MAVRGLSGGIVATALLAAALLVAGCGGSGVTTTQLLIPTTAPAVAARTTTTLTSTTGTVTIGTVHTRTARLPRALVRRARPIGRGAAFHPAARGPVLGDCRRAIGHRVGVHLELFAADKVVLVAPGIGTRPPRTHTGGRIVSAGCYGSLVTLDPTGVLRLRRGVRLTVGDVFRSWGRPLRRDRMLSFHGRVQVYVGGRRWRRTSPARVPLTRHAEIVLEVGPHVPPHRRYHFPPGT